MAAAAVVLADRDPRAAESRVTQPDAAEHGEQDQHERRPEEELDVGERLSERSRWGQVKSGQADRRLGTVAEARRVDRVDPLRAVRHVVAEEVIAVPRDLGHDLGEAERDDRQVVPPRSLRVGNPMMMPTIEVKTAAVNRTIQIEMWMPGVGAMPTAPRWRLALLKCCEANHAAVRAHRVEGDIAEVEEPRRSRRLMFRPSAIAV